MAGAEVRRDNRANFIQQLNLLLIDGRVKILRSDALHVGSLYESFVMEIKELYEREMEKGKKSIERAINDAKEEGLKQGLSRFEEILKKFLDERHKFFRKIESELEALVIPLCERVIEKELEMDRTALLSIIKAELSRLSADSVAVFLNEDDYNEIQRLLPSFFEELKNRKVVFFSDKDLPPNSCILKCSSGEIDASIKTRLRRLSSIVNKEY